MDAEAVGFGPYFARRLSPEWTADASFTFSFLENDERMSVLTSSYESQRFALSTSATGDYSFGEARLYPRVTMSHTILRNDEHDMGGTVMGIPVSVRIAETEVDFGLVEASAELTRGYGAGSTVWYPFAEVGVRFEFERPDGGRIVTGSLTLEETSPWVGSVRAGVRLLPSRQVFIEAGAGYLSLGQNDLDVLEASIYVSIGF